MGEGNKPTAMDFAPTINKLATRMIEVSNNTALTHRFAKRVFSLDVKMLLYPLRQRWLD